MTKKKTTKKKAATAKAKAPEEVTSIPSQEEYDDLEATMVEEKPMSEVSVQELEAMIQLYAQQKDDVEHAEEEVKRLKALKTNTEKRLLAFMEEFDKTSYRSTWGTLVRSGRYSWKTPKTPESREAFFGYLKERGVFDGLISVNSNTLASFAKQEMEAAVERQDIDFAIPGLDDPTYTERVALRKK